MLAIKKYIKSPRKTVIAMLEHFGQWLPDSIYLRLLFRLKMKRKLNLHNPVTYNEKLQWLKLFNRKNEYTVLVDKYEVKEYVSRIIGNEYVIPTLGVWENPDEIDFDLLPNQFVLKTNHSGGSYGVVICRDKSTFNQSSAIDKLKKSMAQDIYRYSKEWPYKNVKRLVLAEQYIEPSWGGKKISKSKDLQDYKFFCFDGEIKALLVATDRQTPGVDVKFDFFDSEFNHLPFRQGHDNASAPPKKPVNFEKMKGLAEKLSKGLPHVRVDFYDLGDRVYFGELTFFHFSGTMPFEPEEWDFTFGSWLKLPVRN